MTDLCRLLEPSISGSFVVFCSRSQPPGFDCIGLWGASKSIGLGRAYGPNSETVLNGFEPEISSLEVRTM